MRRPTCSICTSCSDSSLLWVFPKTSPETITFFSVTGDRDIQRLCGEGKAVIAVSHPHNRQEDLMGSPWLVLAPDALTPDFLKEVYCRHNALPLPVGQTSRCLIRELTSGRSARITFFTAGKSFSARWMLFSCRMSVAGRISPSLYRPPVSFLRFWSLCHYRQNNGNLYGHRRNFRSARYHGTFWLQPFTPVAKAGHCQRSGFHSAGRRKRRNDLRSLLL